MRLFQKCPASPPAHAIWLAGDGIADCLVGYLLIHSPSPLRGVASPLSSPTPFRPASSRRRVAVPPAGRPLSPGRSPFLSDFFADSNAAASGGVTASTAASSLGTGIPAATVTGTGTPAQSPDSTLHAAAGSPGRGGGAGAGRGDAYSAGGNGVATDAVAVAARDEIDVQENAAILAQIVPSTVSAQAESGRGEGGRRGRGVDHTVRGADRKRACNKQHKASIQWHIPGSWVAPAFGVRCPLCTSRGEGGGPRLQRQGEPNRQNGKW